MTAHIIFPALVYVTLGLMLLQMALDESGEKWTMIFKGGKLRGCLVMALYVTLWLPWLIGASTYAFAKALLTSRK